MPTYEGFEKAKQGESLSITPSFVMSREEKRGLDDGIIEPWEKENNTEPSLDVKWGITPNLTLSGTLNPDFFSS